MTDYTVHADAIFGTDKPILGSTHLEARDNLIATAEGAAGAPKIADKTEFAPGGTTTVFTNIGAWGGVWVNVVARDSGGDDVEISFSDNGGSSYYGTTTINTTGAEGSNSTFFVDFATGAYKYILHNPNASPFVAGTTGTVSGLSSSVNTVRIVFPSPTTGGAILRFQGGESAT